MLATLGPKHSPLINVEGAQIMKLATAWRPLVLALALTGAGATTASAAVSDLTLDPTAQLSPGHLHATLTGSITCDFGDNPFISGQIAQPKGASGFGSTQAVCDGTTQPFAIDVSSGIFGPAGVFKAGKASAQVSTSSCDPTMPWMCTTQYVDAVIRLTK
jgi:hypothetical protein